MCIRDRSSAYQPPAANQREVATWQAASPGHFPSPLSQISLAPASTAIPPLPTKLVRSITAGEFTDFSDILRAIELGGREEKPLSLQLGEGHSLTLSHKPSRKEIPDFTTWSNAATICTRYPQRGPDLFAYHHIIACASHEFTVEAYDIAFRKKAAQFHIHRWGEIDPQLYSKVFTAGRAQLASHCSICLSPIHKVEDCPLYAGGPAKPKTAAAGPQRRVVPTHNGKEVCLNWNRGKCRSGSDCPRAHVCAAQGCQGQHKAFQCPSRRSSPRKT